MCCFIEPSTYNGDFHKSVTKFQEHGLSMFDLQIDSTSLPGMPLYSNGDEYVDFYVSYLNMTKRYLNPWSSGVSSYPTFANSNFIIVYDFTKQQVQEGNLNIKLKFLNPLANKLIFLCMPVYQKTLSFGKDLTVQVY